MPGLKWCVPCHVVGWVVSAAAQAGSRSRLGSNEPSGDRSDPPLGVLSKVEECDYNQDRDQIFRESG